MVTTTIIFILLALVLFLVNLRKGRHREGLKEGFKQLKTALPVIILALIMTGLLELLIPEEFIRRWLAQEAGFIGIILGTFGGMIMGIGPYASYPIIAAIYGSGAGLGTTVALLTGWTFLQIVRVPFEAGLLGFRFTLTRMALHLPFCLLTGLIAHGLEVYCL